MPRSYVILYHQPSNSIVIGVKAPKNLFDQNEQFAGGYPAIFGGADKPGGLQTTLSTEVDEESRGTYALDSAAQFAQFFQGQPPFNDQFYYSTSNFRATGNAPRTPKNHDEGEMLNAVKVSINGNFSDQDPPDAVLEKLIRLTNAPGGNARQRDEFFKSETGAALVNFIYSVIP